MYKLSKSLLTGSNFLTINKALGERLGGFEATFLSILIDGGTCVNREWFYQTIPTIEELSFGMLTRTRQKAVIENLTKIGAIEQKNWGIPMKRYFRINEEVISELIKEGQEIIDEKKAKKEEEKLNAEKKMD
ncbi:MAG: hypothetical protein ACRCX2_12520 [Paraclostridium sp.]